MIVTAGNIVLQKSAVEKQACVLIMAAGKNSFIKIAVEKQVLALIMAARNANL